LGEGLVRLLGRAPEVKPIWVSTQESVYQRSTNPVLSFELKPDYRSENPDLIQTFARTNSHGQRDRERTLEKPSGVRRILLLGDSVVEGVGVREQDTMSQQLERLYSGGTTEVLNFGVSGYCTLAEIELLEVKGLAFDPDTVVVVFVENDFHNFNRQGFALASFERPALVKNLFLHSQLFRLLAIRANLFHFGTEVDPAARNREAIGENNVVVGLKRLADLSNRHGFRPIVVIWPAFLDREIRDVHVMAGNPGELVIERLARMNGLPSIRLSTFFTEAWQRDGGRFSPRVRYTIGDELHPSPEGNRVAAASLKTVLERLEAGSYDAVTASPAGHDEAALRAARDLGRKETSNYAVVLVRLGNQAIQNGELEEAVKLFRMALAEDPNEADAHNGLGIVRKHSGDLEAAQASFARAVELAPAFFQARYNLAVVLEQRGKLHEAMRQYQRVLATEPQLTEPRQRIEALRQRLQRTTTQ
jgi:lysophospholipase L1-like esterase